MLGAVVKGIVLLSMVLLSIISLGSDAGAICGWYWLKNASMCICVVSRCEFGRTFLTWLAKMVTALWGSLLVCLLGFVKKVSIAACVVVKNVMSDIGPCNVGCLAGMFCAGSLAFQWEDGL